MRYRSTASVFEEKQSAQSILMDMATLRLELHERTFSHDLKKYNVRTERQLLRSCVDLFKDACEKCKPITTSPDKRAIICENPWFRMVRYASCDDTSQDGRENFWAVLDYAIQTYVDFIESIRKESENVNEQNG